MPVIPVIRNPFAKRFETQDENVRPGYLSTKDAYGGFERVETIGSKASSALSIRSNRSQDTGDYKMSVVNDSGVYLPPSPTEDKGLWPRRQAPSRSSLDTRSSIGDIDHFGISRESFDSYRRSFDISAKSPMPTLSPRPSLDSARMSRFPRTSVRGYSFESDLPTADEDFEDVGLHDEQKNNQQQQQQSQQQPPQPEQPKKKSFFSKFTDSQDSNSSLPGQGMARFIPGRKRGQSGQGAELGRIERPASRARDTPEMVPEMQV